MSTFIGFSLHLPLSCTISIFLIPLSPFSSSSRIFLGILGFGLSIMFCTTFCRVCSRFREEQIDREAARRSNQELRPPIYFIPFHGSLSQHDSEDVPGMPRYSQELYLPPQYNNAAFCGPPPSYNEVILNKQSVCLWHFLSLKPQIYCKIWILTFCFFLCISAGIEAG